MLAAASCLQCWQLQCWCCEVHQLLASFCPNTVLHRMIRRGGNKARHIHIYVYTCIYICTYMYLSICMCIDTSTHLHLMGSSLRIHLENWNYDGPCFSRCGLGVCIRCCGWYLSFRFCTAAQECEPMGAGSSRSYAAEPMSGCAPELRLYCTMPVCLRWPIGGLLWLGGVPWGWRGLLYRTLL